MASGPDSVRHYQVAISFAGEDRSIARQIAENLTEQGIEIFYDSYEEASLWGNNLHEYLTDLYSNRADYCIVLVSRHYATKVWTRVERQAAQARQLLDHDYILPVLIDDTALPGLLATTAYINLRETSVGAVCEIIAAKLSRSTKRDSVLAIGDSRGSASLEASSPAALQHYIGGIYENLGYVVEYDQRAGDLSFNIIARRDVPGVGLEKLAVICDSTGQTGRFDTNLLARYLPLIEAAQDLRMADRCVIVSNGVFTQTARTVSAAAEVLDLISLKSLEQRLLDVVSPLQRYVHDYETSNIFTSYVATGGVLSPLFGNDGEDKVEDLCAEIQTVFERDAASFVSILGDFGGGKTTLLDRLKYEYAMKYLQDKSGLIPVFFQLKDSHRYPELDVLVSRTLQREFEREIPVSLFWDRLESGSFLILLDGFDEMVPNSDCKTRADQFNHLARMFNSKSKIVLTCRPSYFVTQDEYLQSLQRIAKGYRAIEPARPLKRSQTYGEKLHAVANLRQRLSERFLPPQPEATDYSRAITADMLPFSPEKIDSFLQAHDTEILSCTDGRHTARSLREFLERIYDLKDLMCRPILLDMILETVLDGQIDLDDPDVSIGPATLYELYTDMQFDRDWQKGETRQQLLTKEERREFAESLALTMFDQGSLAVRYEQITDLVRQRVDRSDEILTRLESASDEAIATDIQICSFLSRGPDGLFRFAHKSFMEYFVARYLRNILSSERMDLRWARRLPHEILYFLGAYGYVDAEFVHDLDGIHRKLASAPTDIAAEYRMNISAVTIVASQQRRSVHLSRGILDAVQIARLRLRRAELDSWSVIDSRLTHLEFQSSKLLDWSVQGSELVDWRLDDAEARMALRNSEISTLFAQGSVITLSGEKSTLHGVELKDVRLSLEGGVKLVAASISGGAFDLKNEMTTTKALALRSVQVSLGAGATLSDATVTECSILLQGSCSIAETTVAHSTVIADVSAPIELQLHSSVFEECLLSVPPGSRVLMGPNSHVRFENSTVLGLCVGADEPLKLDRLTNCSGYVVDTTKPNPSGKPLAWVSADSGNASRMYMFPADALDGAEVFRLDLAACAQRSELRDKWLKAARTQVEERARALLESCIGEKVKSQVAKHVSKLINSENQSSKISEVAKTARVMQYLDHATLHLLDGIRPELVISVTEFRSILLDFMGSSRTTVYIDALARVWTPGSEPSNPEESKILKLEDLGIPKEILDRICSEKDKQRLTLSQAQNLIDRLLGDKAVDKLCEPVQRRSSDGKKAVINKPFIALLHESQNLFGIARDELISRLEAGVAGCVEEILSRRAGTEMVDLVTGVVLQRFDEVFCKVKVKERRMFRYDSLLEREVSDLGLSKAVIRKLDALDLALHCSREELIRFKKKIEGSDLKIDPVLKASRRSLWDEFAEFIKERLGWDAVDLLSAGTPLSGVGSGAAPSPTVTDIVHQVPKRDHAASSLAVRADMARAGRFIDEAVKLVRRIGDRSDRSEALAELARACITIHPARAEQIARSIPDKIWRAELLEAMSSAHASTDPVRAERTARDIRNAEARAAALAEIAKDCAGLDRARAEQLLADAERDLLDNCEPGTRADVLAAIADVYASFDLARAERIFGLAIQDTQSVVSAAAMAEIVARIVTIGAPLDPRAAEQVARSIRQRHERHMALAAVAKAWAPVDHVHAARIAHSMPYEHGRAEVLASVAVGCAGRDGTRAKRLLNQAVDRARATPDIGKRAETLVAVAMTCAGMAPARAKQLFAEAEETVRAIPVNDPARIEALLRIAAVAAGKPYPGADHGTYKQA